MRIIAFILDQKVVDGILRRLARAEGQQPPARASRGFGPRGSFVSRCIEGPEGGEPVKVSPEVGSRVRWHGPSPGPGSATAPSRLGDGPWVLFLRPFLTLRRVETPLRAAYHRVR